MGCMPKIGKRANEQVGCFNMVQSLFDVYLDRPFHILYFYMFAMEIWIVKRRSTEQNIDEIQRNKGIHIVLDPHSMGIVFVCLLYYAVCFGHKV